EERRRNAAANFEQTTRLYNGQNQRIQQLDQQLASAGAEKLRREEETAAHALPPMPPNSAPPWPNSTHACAPSATKPKSSARSEPALPPAPPNWPPTS